MHVEADIEGLRASFNRVKLVCAGEIKWGDYLVSIGPGAQSAPWSFAVVPQFPQTNLGSLEYFSSSVVRPARRSSHMCAL
jgi:hypothetical protein